MKKLLFLLAMLLATAFSNAQTIHFFEDFDPPSGADLVTPSGSSNFAINTRLHYSGTQCDTLKAPLNGISYLTTQSFNTTGSSNVLLKFAHICKVEIFDTAKVEISVNGGPWIKLTTQYVNPGNSQFLNQSNRFCAATYPVDWVASNDTIKPLQNWWKYEIFDISALAANSSSVQVRFTLRGNASNDVCHGWYLDDISVVGGISELLPPTITMKAPIVQDTVMYTGPFDIYATMVDASGIDTAYIVYQLNGGANQYIPMAWVSDSTFMGTIPSYTYNNRIDYHVSAADSSALNNAANGPNQWFYIKHGPSQILIGSENLVPTYTLYSPIYRYSSTSTTTNSCSNIIYTAAELAAAGIFPGTTITSLAFDKNGLGATNTNPLEFSIYMASTGNTPPLSTATTWGSILASHTLVYSQTAQQIPAVSGWVVFTLTTPFVYTGGSLEIATRAGFSGTQPVSTDKLDWKYSSGTADKIIAYVGTSITTATVLSATTAAYKHRPNIKIGLVSTNYSEDAGVLQILGPSGIILTNTNYPVTLKIKNFATDSLKKVTVAWELDGVLQTPSYSWTGVLLQDVVSGTINMGNVNVSTLGNHTIRAWTELPNDSVDENSINDTATITFYACSSILNGVYTIGPSGADFPTFAAAFSAMQNCGISGPVTFNVQTGTYTEQLDIPEISGTSATNTITFQSLTSVNTDVTLQFTTDATTNYVVKLNGADHFRFRNMTLLSTATTAYTRVIEMAGNAIDNQFDGNIIMGPVATASSVNTALVYSGAGLDSLSVFNNNTITNGSYGLYLSGTSTSVLENKTRVTNNTFNNQYSYAIRLYYQNAPTISGNIINGHTTNTSYYGIYAGYCDNDLKILKNKVFIPAGGYGIEVYYSDGTGAKRGLIANNFVQIGGTTTAYGLYPYYATYQDFYFNSVNITSTSAASGRAMFLSSGCTSVNVKNNILSNAGGGYSFYSSVTTIGAITSDNNDLYTTGTTLGYWTAARADLAAWQAVSLLDSNSVSVDPNFVNSTDLHTFTSSLNGYATPIAGITDDIDGDVRDVSNPDIGADEFAPLSIDLGIVGVLAPIPVSCGLGAAENVTIQLKNLGGNTITTADIYYILNNGTPVHGVFNGSILSDSTVNYTFPTPANLSAIANYTFDFYVVLAGDLNTLNDTISNYAVSNGWDFYSSEYNMGFEPTEDMSSWTIVNSDLGTYKWVMPYASSTYAHSGTSSAQFYNGAANTGEDWLFSRCFYLEAGKTYSLSFWYRAYSATYPQTLTLKYGNAANSAAMTTTLTTITGFTNATHQQSITQFVAPANGIYYFGWSGTVGVAYYAYIDDINLKLIPPQEAALLSIIAPETGCGLTNAEPVTIKIKNTGGNTISGNLSAYYKIGGGSTVSEPVTNAILPGDTLAFTFGTPANLVVTTQDSTFAFKSWIALAGDPFQTNDTISADVNSIHTPANPTVVDDTVPYGGIATLQALSPDNVFWYVDDTTNVYFNQGNSYTTPVLFDTVTYYVSAGSGSASYVGMVSSVNGTSGSGMTTYGLYFDALSAFTLSSVEVYANSASNNTPGTVTISVIDGAGAVLHQATVNVTGNIQSSNPTSEIVDLNFNILPANGLRLVLTAKSSNISGLMFQPSSGGPYPYPYTLPGIVSITSGTYSGNVYPSLYYYFYNWKIGGGGCSSARVPVTAYVQLSPYEASVVGMPSPVDQCSDGSENVTIRIKNNGTNTISGGLTAKYTVNGSAPVVEPVTNTILPGDTLTYTFSTPFAAGLTTTNQDSVYNIMSYIELSGDNYYINDTIKDTVTLNYIPLVPVVSNITIPYGTSGTLTATAADSVFWFDVPTGGTEIATGSMYTTPVLFGTTVYHVEARAGTATQYVGPYDYSIGTSSTYANTTYYLYFDVLEASGITIQSIDVFPSTAPGAAYSIQLLNSSGVVLQTYSGVTTVAAGQRETAPVNFSVPFGTDYRVKFGVSGGFYRNTTGATYPYVIPNVISIDGNSFTGYPQYYYFFYNWKIGGGNLCASARVPDTVFVTGIPACDVSVETIYTPNTGIELTNSEPVTVRVKNYGTSPALNVPIHYVINGGTVVNDVIPGPIATNDTVLFTFATPANLSAFATYNLTVYTNLSCDATLVNDTVHKTVINNPLVYCTSNATSTSDCDISNVTVSNLNNGIALPVYSNPTCTATYSNFTSLPPALLMAGMSYPISVSQCNTSTTFWVSMVNVYLDYNRNGVFDLPGEKVFSAPTSSAATTVSGSFTIPTSGIVTNLPIRMRVVLDESDVAPACGTYSWGETEDYSVILLPQIPHDAGVTAFVQPTSPQNEGVSTPVQVTVKNYGLDPITNASNMLVVYSYNGGAPQSITWTGGTIAPLATATVTLPNITVLPNDRSLCAWTVLAGDSNTMNDTTCMTLHGNPQIDAGIIAFVQPGASLNQGANATVQVTLENFGVDTLTSMNLVYKLNGVIQATQLWTGTLLPGASTDVTFTQTFVVPMAAFSICAYSSIATDANHANDTLCMSAYGVFTSTLPYYDNFDGATINWLAGPVSSGSLWELGTPNFGATNSAHSAPNAWDVNLTTAYTNSATTYLYTQNFDFSTAVNARMKFWLNYNVQATYDGLRLEYTTDGGTTWNTLGVLNDVNGVNWYNSASITASGLPGWTNTSSGWKQSEYKLNILNNVPLVRFRFVFNSNASTVASGASVDDFSITIPAPLDAGVEVIHKPVVQTPGGALTNVKVRIRNFGSDTLTSIPVSYRVGLTGIPVVQTWTGTLYPDDTATVNFTSALTPPTGIFDLYSYTGLAADGDHLNDTAKNCITGVPTYPVPYSDNFEGLVTWFSPGTLWEYGVPAATVINSAYSPTHAWVTNLDGDYTDLATEYLYTPLFMFTGVDSAYLEFRHWYEAELSWDGGTVEYSIGGGTWTVLGTTSDVNGLNWYNSTVSTMPSWSGSSGGYVYSKYRLASIPAIVNAVLPVQFRFKFHSDGGGTDEGWAIDNFAITAPQIPIDAGVSAILLPNAATQTGSPVTVEVTIKNYGTTSLSSIPVRYVINGGAVTSETWSGTLASGATTNYTFTAPYTSPGSTYELCAFTKVTGDTYTFNDTTCGSFNTTAAPHDVGVVAILQPNDTTTYNQADSVKVLIKNFGTSPETSIPVVYLRNSVQIGAGSWTGVLNGGATVLYTFAVPSISPQGNYVLCAKTMLVGDSDPANDDSCSYLYGMTGIETFNYSGFVLYQNVPNPAGITTSIVFYVPVGDKVRFEMYDVLGKAIRVDDIDAVKGENMIELNAASMSEGIYLYSVSYKGHKLTKRMVVTK